MKIPIDQIKFVKDLYPRFELDNYTVNQYRQSVEILPPIIISKTKVLIDGYHRLVAHRLEGLTEIEAEMLDIEDDNEIFVEAIRRNSTHGKQLTIEEKQRLTPILYGRGVSLEDIQSILAIGKQKAYDWTQSLRDKETEQRNVEILELYLQCWTQEQIAHKLGIHQTTVGDIIKGISTDGKNLTPDNLQLYNVWSVGRLNLDQLKYPGQTPQDIVENIIYYYTDPPQTGRLNLSKVVDPMAGSGIVRDVCRKLYRRYLLYDIQPIREDIPIKQNDITKGFPDEAKNTDLVYFDPPYYNLMSEYPDNEFTSTYNEFLNVMETSFKNFKDILNKKGKVALILKPMNKEMLGGEWLDLTFDSIQIAKTLGYKIIKRIAAPLSTQQFTPFDVTRAKEQKIMLNTLRDITIMEKQQ